MLGNSVRKERSADMLTAQWYAIHTHVQQENRAASNLEAWGVETFSPLYKECRYNQFTGAPTYFSKHFFPRYIFARFDAATLLHKICCTRGVHSVVSFGNGPIPIDDEVIRFIKERVGADGFIKIGEELKPGDQVKIKAGPLKNLTGVFECKMNASHRVQVLLKAINYQCRIQVDKSMIEKAAKEMNA
jgi:transcriptional antiterminator RfaH